MAEPVVAIYPGSFDPVTNGHLDIISRSRDVFDTVIVAVLQNLEKKPLFSADERLGMLREVTAAWDNVKVDSFDGLLVKYAVQKGARVIVRGIRAVTDYEYEFQMALMNRRIESSIETIFMLPSSEYSYLSSSLIKEVYALRGNITGLVPEVVESSLRELEG
jgi:pantetheine-phosphate adenylyltransferase